MLNSPERRSKLLDSFSKPLACRVQRADSYEHQAVETVASAMINAEIGSTHFFFEGA
jgi:hypothetical protein